VFFLQFDFARSVCGQGVIMQFGKELEIEFCRTILGIDFQHLVFRPEKADARAFTARPSFLVQSPTRTLKSVP